MIDAEREEIRRDVLNLDKLFFTEIQWHAKVWEPLAESVKM